MNLSTMSEIEYKEAVRVAKIAAKELSSDLEKLAYPLLKKIQESFKTGMNLLRDLTHELEKIQREYPYQDTRPAGPALIVTRALYRFMVGVRSGNFAMLQRAGCALDLWEESSEAARLCGEKDQITRAYRGDEPSPSEKAAAAAAYRAAIAEHGRKAAGLVKSIRELRPLAVEIYEKNQAMIRAAKKQNPLLTQNPIYTNHSVEIVGCIDLIIRALDRESRM